MATDDDADPARSLPPAGWLRDPAGQTRWWDGAQWTEHVRPARNGPAIASLTLIAVQLLLGSAWFVLGFYAASAGLTSYQWLIMLGGVLSWLLCISAVVLGVIATVIAVRRPTAKGPAVFALVASSVLLILLLF
ncbi:DUF2510 domain-containing protein [Microbacterium sp. NEAU-LLC]|uniref:DUF2510 domain-containing protein n=1 Tax=Microbacterium helvum TaxID=2773713 RepID=A0ABR8NUV7_9MICO|nr:DUF2510 domain-containing protein [Microbacterium helvum]MBD3943828.1 DUF2510 domain-containing protein [Microbacterium helvum]